LFSAALNENPPPESQIKSVLPLFKYLGIELGKPWKRENVNPLILEEMKVAAQQVGSMMNVVGPIVGKPTNGWDVPPVNFGAIGSDGKPLNGSTAYTITFKASNPYIQVIPPGFWSVTMYDGLTKFTVPN